MDGIDAADHEAQCLACQVGDCDYLAFGYPFCSGCREHHRAPVGTPCPVDEYEARYARNEAAGRDGWDDGDSVIDIPPKGLPPSS